MLGNENARVHIFEGVDVTGKTTQAKKLLDYFGDKAVSFKFPSKMVKVKFSNHIFCSDVYMIHAAFMHINRVFPSVVVCEQPNKKECCEFNVDIYKLFDLIHKYIYGNKFADIYEDFVISEVDSIIKDLMIVDIFTNAYDKYEFLINELPNYIKQDKIVIIDRFFMSGDVYNCHVPLDYLCSVLWSSVVLARQTFDNIEEKKRIEDKYYKSIDLIRKISNVSTICLKLLMNTVLVKTKPGDKIDRSLVVPTFDSIFGSLFNFDTRSIDVHLNNKDVVQYYFKPSEILYEEFNKKIAEDKQDREVSKYDTNKSLRAFAIGEYDRDIKDVREFSRDSIYEIDTDSVLNFIKLDEVRKDKDPIDGLFDYFRIISKIN